MSSSLILELHLIEHVLILSIHQRARQGVTGDHVGTNVSAPLNVLPRLLCPTLTRAALVEMPWVDLDFCSRVGDLNLLQFMVNDWTRSRARFERKNPGRDEARPVPSGQDDEEARDQGHDFVDKCRWRPLQWSRESLVFAAKNGHVHILEWWRQQQQVLLTFDWALIVSSAGRAGCLDILHWCDANVPVGFKLPTLYPYSDFSFSVDAMKWWLDRLPVPEACPAVLGEDEGMFLNKAVRAGSVEALQWMYDNGYPLDFSLIVQEANSHGQVSVLDWVLVTVPRERMVEVGANYIKTFTGSGASKSPCSGLYYLHFGVNQQQVIRWWIARAPWALFFDPIEAKRTAIVCARAGFLSELRPMLETRLVQPSRDLLIAGCESGDLNVVRYLFDRGCWDSKEPQCDCRSPACFKDPYIAASGFDNVDVLDFLLSVIPLDTASFEAAFLGIAQCGRRQSAEALQWWEGVIPGILAKIAPVGYRRLSSHLANACSKGNLEFVKCWAEATAEAHVVSFLDISCVHAASVAGQLHVLDYLFQVVPDTVKEGVGACMTAASASDCVQSLEWWKRQGIMPDECPYFAIDSASAAGFVGVLDWWLCQSGLPLCYTHNAMDNASINGRISVLEWWYSASLTHDIQLKYSPAALTASLEDGVTGAPRLQVLRWWRLRGCTFPGGMARYRLSPWPSTHQEQLSTVFVMGNVFELELLMKLGLQLGSTDASIMDHASYMGHVSVLHFLMHNLRSFDIDFSAEAIINAAKRGDTATWEWWRRSELFDAEELELGLKAARDGWGH